MEVELKNMDCIEYMKTLPEKFIDCVLIDPPYYKIKEDQWDRQWDSLIDYISWMKSVFVEIKRVLKDTGSLYVFADDFNVSYLQVELDKEFCFLNHLIWFKNNNLPLKYASNMRKYAPMSERILFYSKIKNIVPDIRDYMLSELIRSGLKLSEIKDLLGRKGNSFYNFFAIEQRDNKTEFSMINEKDYLILQKTGYWKKPYEELRKEFEQKRRTYNFKRNIHEIITEPVIKPNENTTHSTTKPIRLIRKLIYASSNSGDNILDCFMGSGTTALACIQMNRNVYGCEISKEYFELINNRVLEIQKQKRLDSYE